MDYFNDTYEFNILTNTWKKYETSGIPPSIRCWHSASIYDNLMIIFGGFYWDGHEHYYDDLFTLDLKSLIWTRILAQGTAPHARNRHSAVIYPSSDHNSIHIQILCGNFYNDITRKGNFFNDAYTLTRTVHDPANITWTWQMLQVSNNAPSRGNL